jgi:hypothetical protein
MNKEQYIKERLDDQIKWYSSKSRSNQKMYKRLRFLEISSASTIPFLSGFSSTIPYSEWIIALLGMVIAISAGAGSLFKYHENWLEYRSTTEALKQEKVLYLTEVAPYDTEDRFKVLVTRAENIMSNEKNNWLKYTTQKA